jgi:hypothetical protein
MPTKNEKFIAALKSMNKIMKQDNAAGHQWTYCNKSGKKSKDFDSARKEGKYLVNCVDGCQWGLKKAGIPSSALSWYGGMGHIVWLNPNAEKNAKKYFDIIYLNMKVTTAVKKGKLCEGDILIYTSMNHTNAYLGWGRSFDSGHAYCTRSGEGAPFTKWIGELSCKNHKISYVLRLKDRQHFRVVLGTYDFVDNAKAFAEKVSKMGAKVTINEVGDKFKVQAGYFDGRVNAEALQDTLTKKGIISVIEAV